MGFAITKPTFAGGEFSPTLWSRVDLQKYSTGARKLRNWIVHAEGGASTRPGLHYIAQAKYDNKEFRLIPFEFSDDERYMIEAGDYYFRFYTNGAQITVSSASAWVTTTAYVRGDYVSNAGTIYYCNTDHTANVFATDLSNQLWTAQTAYEIPSPYAEADLEFLQYAQSADVLFLAHPDFAPRELARIANTNWTLSTYVFENGPFMLMNTDESVTLTASAVTGNGITVTASSATFYSTHIGSLWQTKHYIEGQTQSVSMTSATTSSSIKCGGTWRIITHGTWTGKLRVEKSTDGGSTWTTVRTFGSTADNNVNTYQEDSNDGEPYLVRLNMYSYTSGTANVELTTDAFWQTGIFEITAYASATSVTADVKTELGATSATSEWSEGSWSGRRGYPATVSFSSADRLTWANTYAEPQTFWMTESGNYYSFKRSSPLVDSDGISTPLPSKKLNGISGLVPLLDLVALTSSGLWSLGSGGQPISPTTINPKLNDYHGAAGVTPVVIGNRAIYVQAGGSVVRDMTYELASDGFVSTNASIISRHLFKNHRIVEMAYQQEPDSIVWCVRDDGWLLAMTYLREQEVLAWTPHYTNGGDDEFMTVATISGSNEQDEVWVGVRRGTERFIERMDERLVSEDPADQFCVDCGVTYDGVPITTVTGLDHLDGKEVSILADGGVVPPMTVSSGQITIPYPASKIHVGLGYECDLETLNVEANTRGGTIQGKLIKITDVVLQLVNSKGGQIGPDFDTLHDMVYNLPDNYGEPSGLYTGETKELLGGGYEEGGRVCIRQSDPLPMTIASIIPTVTVGG